MTEDKVEEIRRKSPGGLKGALLILLGIVAVFILYFAIVSSGEVPGEDSFEETAAVTAVKEDFRERIGATDYTEIEIVAVSEETWPNSCLGLDSQDEICTQALTQGYRIEVQNFLTIAAYRTNLTGSTIKLEFLD